MLALVLGVIAALSYFGSERTQLQSGILLPQPRTLPDFVLSDHRGQPFTKAALAGHWSLLFAGFATCPDACPTTLAFLKKLEAGLKARNLPLTVVFLSVDPDRDTAPRLAAYLEYYNPDFLGVTAPEPELAKVAQAFGIAYAKVPGETPEIYSVDHSAALILVNPQAEIAAYFLPPHDLDALGADLAQVIGSRL